MRRVKAGALEALTARIVERAGSSADEAAIVAGNLVRANLWGHDSHGVALLPRYIASAKDGRLAPNTRGRVVSDRGPFLLVDGGMGYGQVVGIDAMNAGLARARELGVAIVGTRSAHHLGRIGEWGEMCARAGFVSIHYVNAIWINLLVAPHGGSDARFSTNPTCIALPATPENPPIVLDMATSAIAMGKVQVAYNKGVKVPPGSLIDEKGNPTDDPGVMLPRPARGALLAAGGHKGYALAVLCELLAGALTGGGATDPETAARDQIKNNMLSIIFDPDGFGLGEGWKAEVDRFTGFVKASPPAPGVEQVMVPGDPERKTKAERERLGVPMDDGTWAGILEAGRLVGLNDVAFEPLRA
jgi:hydroxycarboxylate dehydrogenase B